MSSHCTYFFFSIFILFYKKRSCTYICIGDDFLIAIIEIRRNWKITLCCCCSFSLSKNIINSNGSSRESNVLHFVSIRHWCHRHHIEKCYSSKMLFVENLQFSFQQAIACCYYWFFSLIIKVAFSVWQKCKWGEQMHERQLALIMNFSPHLKMINTFAVLLIQGSSCICFVCVCRYAINNIAI